MARSLVLTVTDTFLDAIRAPHMLATLATVTPPSGDAVDVLVNDGSVVIDRTADQRRSLDLTVADPSLYPEATTDVLNVYGSEITVSRGVEYAVTRPAVRSGTGCVSSADPTAETWRWDSQTAQAFVEAGGA